MFEDLFCSITDKELTFKEKITDCVDIIKWYQAQNIALHRGFHVPGECDGHEGFYFRNLHDGGVWFHPYDSSIRFICPYWGDIPETLKY